MHRLCLHKICRPAALLLQCQQCRQQCIIKLKTHANNADALHWRVAHA